MRKVDEGEGGRIGEGREGGTIQVSGYLLDCVSWHSNTSIISESFG